MTFRVVRTNQYNQDLGLIHSTNGNHLESPNEGSSIDHQVTIHLHAQNITMFPTTETCFLGCPSVLNEQELERFFDTALIQDGVVTCAVSGKYVEISISRFVGVFNLPTYGLIDLSEVPNDLVLQARTLFSHSGKPVQFSCKKRLLKCEFCLLNDILAKSITVKAGSFDAVTHERFLMVTAIHFGVKVNWSEILFEVLKEMVDRTTRRAKGFAAQICVLLKGDLAVTLGEAKTFPPLKILSEKMVHTYIATNKTIDARGETDESDVAAVDIVKKKSVTKKRPAAVSEAPVAKKKRTSSGKAVSKEKDLAIVSVALDAEPIQTVDPTSVMPAPYPPVPKRRAPKRKLRMTAGSDDEFVEKESAVETAVVVQKAPTSADDVDTIIEEVIAETAQMEQADFVESAIAEGIEMETVLADPVVTKSDNVIVEVDESSAATTAKEIDLATMPDVGQLSSGEELLSIDDLLKRIPGDMMLPSVLADEPTRIKFGHGISIPGVADGDLYKASLPKITLTNKGKAPLVEVSVVKGHPAREMVELIFGDIEFLIQVVEDGYDRWVHEDATPVSQLIVQMPQRTSLESLAPICLFFQPVQCLSISTSLYVKTWGLYRVCTEVLRYLMLGCLKPVGSFTVYIDIVPIGPVLGDFSIPRRVVDNVSYRIQILDSALPHFSAQISPSIDISSAPTDFVISSPHQSSSSASSMHFTYDIPQGTETAGDQTLEPVNATATDINEQFALLRTSISENSIKQLRTQSKIGDLQNLSFLRSILTRKLLPGQKAVRAQNAFVTIDLADLRKDVKGLKANLSKEFDDKLDVIRNDLLEFRVETQGQLASLGTNLAELIAFITKCGDDKNGEVSSSHGRAQPPPGVGGSGGSRSEPSRKRGSSGSRQKSWRYWLNE
ncbi:adoMet-dependent rRNA methyltransferase spb1 [Dorcoceras hygrometricum]|uniref:AdoMet-dependent rRNA methyltransferase spb1 n=1 Tax=Dorcoceras hygrometricum TaxID=472368 RepID=A0A2Z7B0P6_9LAMI|nr:adoMet-dependent rRNA methyltransferase spb1 [Dorcoceras hygrometricum]